MKKPPFILLAILCILSFSSMRAQTSVAPALGTGTISDPYRIATLSNLYWLSQNSTQWAAGKYFIQTANIDAAATNTWFTDGSGGYYGFPTMGGGSLSVGNKVNGTFSASYDGQGYAISNLYINRSPEQVALFGFALNATFKNLDLINPTVLVGLPGGSSSIGYQGNAIFLASGTATLNNIHIKTGVLTVNSWHNYTGAMLGRVGGIQATNCSADAVINTTTTYGGNSGGFMGYSESSTSSFTNCYATGSITCNNGSAGGFTGMSFGGTYTYARCYSEVNVNAAYAAGGFAGIIYANGASFSNCYARGSVTAGSIAGGFSGNAYTGGASTLTNCYATGAVTAPSSGGFAGVAGPHTYSNCFWDNQTAGTSISFGSGSSAGVTAKTTAQMKTAATFTAATWDYYGETTNGSNDYWYTDGITNAGYPWLIGSIREWTGSANTSWSNAANWKNSILPTTTSIVRLLSTAPNLPVVDADISIDRFNFNGVNYIMDLGNYTLTCGQVLASGPAQYIKTSGTGVLTIKIVNNNFGYFPVGLSAFNPVAIGNTSGAPDFFSVKVLDEVYTDGASGATVSEKRVKRTWDINRINPNGGSGVNFTFNWNAGETSAAIATPALFHYAGGWTKQTGTTNFTSTSLTYTGYTGTFSPFAIAEASVTLPVKWLSFTATKQAKTVELNWSTASEDGAESYVVQHSGDAINWNSLSTVTAAGHSTTIQQYAYAHNSPVTGNNYYRLIQRDMDGKESYSKIVQVKFEATGKQMLIYPNPVLNGKLNIQLEKTQQVFIYNAAGAVVLQQNINKGTHELNLQQLAKGLYHIKAGEETLSFIIK